MLVVPRMADHTHCWTVSEEIMARQLGKQSDVIQATLFNFGVWLSASHVGISIGQGWIQDEILGEARSDDGENTKPYIDTVFYNDHNHPYAYMQQIPMYDMFHLVYHILK